jgi:hypothetical protein
MKRIYEVSAMVYYTVVVLASSKKQALKHVATWEHAWDANADLISVSDIEVTDVRPGTADDADEVVA